MKMVLARSALKKKLRYVKLLYWSLNRWRIRRKLERFIKKLGLTRDTLMKCGRARLIQAEWKRHIRYIRFRDMIISRLQSNYRMQKVQNVSFIQALKLKLPRKSLENDLNNTELLDDSSERDIFYFKGPRKQSIPK